MAELSFQDRIYGEAQQLMKIGSWVLDLVTHELRCTEEIYNIFEIDNLTSSLTQESLLHTVHPDDLEKVSAAFAQSIKSKQSYYVEYRLCMANDTIKHIQERGKITYDATGKPVSCLGAVQDITERVVKEKAQSSSLKMEAIVQLSGGVAHDFNNKLGIILGYLDFLKQSVGNNDEQNEWVDTATNATLSCVELTRQLLAFSCHRPKEKKALDINQTIIAQQKELADSITPNIEMQYSLANDLWKIESNVKEFQGAIMNLVTNACEAMVDGGGLIIETSNICLDEEYAILTPELAPGEYVSLALSDTGTGITPETLNRIFEPFFTTKPKGMGSGLGLTGTYCYAKRHGGALKVYSEVGLGTTMRIFLPRFLPPEQQADSDRIHKNDMPTGTETILIVDDETDLLALTNKQLAQLGYTTYCANDAAQAIEILETHTGIDLLFSDVVMSSDMNGYELAQLATQQNPSLKVLLTSGFTSKTTIKNGLSRYSANLLSKPYSKFDLAQRIRLMLDMKAVK